MNSIFNTLIIFICIIICTCCNCQLSVLSSSSTSQEYILSITTLISANDDQTKQITLIDPFTNLIISNSTIEIPFEILDILFFDFIENTAVILCENVTNDSFIMVNLENINSKDVSYVGSTEIKNSLSQQDYTRNILQKFIFNNKIGYIPIEILVNQTYYIMELNFPYGYIHFIELLPDNDDDTQQQQSLHSKTTTTIDNNSTSFKIIQGFDYISKIMYLTYKSINNNYYNLLWYNPIYPSIQNQTIIKNIDSEINMIFTDLNSNIYIISNNKYICKFDFKSSICNNIYTINNTNNNNNNNNNEHFQPYFLNQDKSLLIILSIDYNNNNNLNFEIININNNFSSTVLIIPSTSNNSNTIWTKYAF